jgi:hypothetical protein
MRGMETLLHLWDELDELLGLVWHAGVALTADLRGLAHVLMTVTSTAAAWLRS